MRFHLPSFLLGVAAGASGVAFAERIRPVVREMATACFGVYDSAMLRIARAREDTADLLAEARATARERVRKRNNRANGGVYA